MVSGVENKEMVLGLFKKTADVKNKQSFLTVCRRLVHLFCLQMWSADCRHETSSKTNSTLVMMEHKKISVTIVKYMSLQILTIINHNSTPSL